MLFPRGRVLYCMIYNTSQKAFHCCPSKRPVKVLQNSYNLIQVRERFLKQTQKCATGKLYATAFDSNKMETSKREEQTASEFECSVASLDHFVITVANVDKTVDFYTKVLGMKVEKFGQGRLALKFGNQKINIHQYGAEFKPHADKPTPGSADVCFVTKQPLEIWIKKLQILNQVIVEGPVARTGAMGPINSIYLRDPDLNLIEISVYNNN